MMEFTLRNFVKSATALAAVFSNFGFAQAQVPNPPPAEEADEIVMDEIIITAQKREQRLSEVPLAVTAYSGTFLDKIGVTKFDELALFTPGLRVQEQSANNPGFVVRGITTDSGSAFDEPRVAIFQDGVSTSRNRGAYVELFDLERVEVAKGPQATLFGRAAMIGGINVIQNKQTSIASVAILKLALVRTAICEQLACSMLPSLMECLDCASVRQTVNEMVG